MLFFFDDEELRHLIDRKNFGPFKVPPLDHSLETLPFYVSMWKTTLEPYLQELNKKVIENPYISVEEREDINLLGRIQNILPHLNSTVKFGKKTEQLDGLKERLAYLENYGSQETQCRIYKDFAPFSFSFVLYRKSKEGEWEPWFNGGLIYHGPHDNGGDGGAPTFSVNLSSHHGWAIHT